MTIKSLGTISAKSASYIKKANVMLDGVLRNSESYAQFVDTVRESGLIQDPHTERVLSMIQYKLLGQSAPNQVELDALVGSLNNAFGEEANGKHLQTIAFMALDEEDRQMSENGQNWCHIIFQQHDAMNMIVDRLQYIFWEGTPSPSERKIKVLAQLWEASWLQLARQSGYFKVLILGQLADKYSCVQEQLSHGKELVNSVQLGIDRVLAENKDVNAWYLGWEQDEKKLREMKSSLARQALEQIAKPGSAPGIGKPKM